MNSADLIPNADLVAAAAGVGMTVNGHDWVACLAIQRGQDVTPAQRRRVIAASMKADGYLNARSA